VGCSGRAEGNQARRTVSKTVMAYGHERNAINAARRASQREAARVHLQMRRGLNSLATVASLAPFVGLLGTVLGMMSMFKGFNGSAADGLALVARGLSESIVTTGLGLVVAIPAFWFYHYLRNSADAFDGEMERVCSALALRADFITTS